MTDISATIQKSIKDHETAVRGVSDGETVIAAMVQKISASLKAGGTLILCGNGGSATDAEHVAGEFLGRYKKERHAWPAIALPSHTAALTAIGNDYGYGEVFARQVQAFGKKDDVVVGISTSGNSKNVLGAMHAARERGCVTIGVTGKSGGALAGVVDICFRAGSDDTPRVQEAHILMWHIVCELVDMQLIGDV